MASLNPGDLLILAFLLNVLQFKESVPDLVKRLDRLNTIKPQQLNLQLLPIPAQLSSQNVALPLKLFLIRILELQIL